MNNMQHTGDITDVTDVTDVTNVTLRIAGTVNDSIVDGPGLRFTVFTQGCPHHCKGCHNPHTHDFNGGREIKASELVEAFSRNPLLDGITLSGGEPFCQAKALTAVAKAAHDKGLNVLAYTGYVYEELAEGSNSENGWHELLRNIDWLIDGKFELENRSLELRFKGSRNQRTIDVKKSLEKGQAVTFEFE